MNKLIVTTVITLLTGCLPVVPATDSGVKTITINKFSPSDYAAKWGANCEKLNLATLAAMTKLTDQGCALVDNTLNTFALAVKGSGAAPECQAAIPEAGGAFNQPVNIDLYKVCDYTISLRIGYQGNGGAWNLFTGERAITSAELTSAPGDQLNVQIPMNLTSDGQAFGFIGDTPINTPGTVNVTINPTLNTPGTNPPVNNPPINNNPPIGGPIGPTGPTNTPTNVAKLKTIIDTNCISCHATGKPAAQYIDLTLFGPEALIAGPVGNLIAIRDLLTTTNIAKRMPKSMNPAIPAQPLPQTDIDFFNYLINTK